MSNVPPNPAAPTGGVTYVSLPQRTQPMTDRTIGTVIQEIMSSVQEILRGEVRLAKAEIREELGKFTWAAIFLVAAALLALFALGLLLAAAVLALISAGLPGWGAALLVGILVLLIAGGLYFVGRGKLADIHPKPEKTIENVKENIEWLKQQTKS